MATEGKTQQAPAQATQAMGARSREASNGLARANGRSTASQPLLGLQQTVGNQAVLRLLEAGALQAKLRISQPGDADEREADRVAERVASSAGQPAIHRKCNCEGGGASCPACEEEEVEQGKGIHRKANTAYDGDRSVHSDLLQSMGPGEPLDSSTRGFMESRFGRDFGSVRIHAGDQAAESARFIQARAFTAGSHVVFDKDEYHPQSISGRRLLAHELTHVAQQSQTGQSNVVHRAPPQQQMPANEHPDTFTLVRTKRLNAQGPFTSEVLRQVSMMFAKFTVFGGPGLGAALAQRAVDLLEASDSFVQVANELDKFHLKKGNPTFHIFWGWPGTKFVPAGTSYQEAPITDVNVQPDENQILIDYGSSMNLYGTDAQKIVQFVSIFIHESRHAYNHIMKITRGGLLGHLEEEQRTRKAEIKGLQEIKGRTSDKDVQSEVDARVSAIKRGGVTNRDIAEDLISGGGGTYLETFFVESAIGDLTARKAQLEATLQKTNSPIPDALARIETVTPSDLDNYNQSAVDTTVRYFLAPYMEKSSLTPGHTPTQVEVDFVQKFRLMDLTLKQVTDFKPPRLSDEYRYVYLYLALVKAYRIKAKIAQAWEHFQNDPDPNKKKSDIIEKNARDLLGIPRAYSGIRG